MTKLKIFDEPLLEFAFGQQLAHPRDGLSLFGPYDSAGVKNPRTLVHGVVGTNAGVQKFQDFVKRIAHPINTHKNLDDTLWPHYPGFEAAFHARVMEKPAWQYSIDNDKLLAATSSKDEYARVFGVVNLYLEAIRIAKKTDTAFHCMFCIVPDIVHKNCRPRSRVEDGTGTRPNSRQRKSRAVMADFFDSYDSSQYWYSVDCWRSLKVDPGFSSKTDPAFFVVHG
ncbi:MAG TPA: hypothetical protein VFE27_16265 [Acidobacteriaceae bacterium]|jgi:hypothetical protein|nr:hypothetical protein [Acidobacteriaceae bacterium]